MKCSCGLVYGVIIFLNLFTATSGFSIPPDFFQPPDILRTGTRNEIRFSPNGKPGLLESPLSSEKNSGDRLNTTLLGFAAGGPSFGVAVEGDYAYFSNGGSLQIVDITDPGSPDVVGELVLPDVMYGVEVVGNLAYVAVGDGGLRTIDVGTPSQPFEVGKLDARDRAKDIEVVGDLAFIADNGLRVVDVSNSSNPTELGFLSMEGQITDVEVEGNFVYVANYSGGELGIIDVSNPANPIQVGFFPFELYSIYGLAVSGGLAFTTETGTEVGMRIIDVSNPAIPVEISQIYSDYSEFYDVVVSGGYAYLSGDYLRILDVSNPYFPIVESQISSSWLGDIILDGNIVFATGGSNGLLIFDVNLPSNPFQVGHLEAGSGANGVTVSGEYAYVASYHGFHVMDVSDLSSPVEVGFVSGSNEFRISVSGNHAYVASITNGLRIIDVSTPTSPVQVGQYSIGWVYDVVVDGDLVYLASTLEGLHIVDVSNPSNPYQVGHFGEGLAAVSVAISDGYAFVAADEWGLLVLDISDPANPVEVSRVLTAGWAHGIAVDGNFAYIADSFAGFAVFDVTNASHPFEVGRLDSGDSGIDVFISDGFTYVADLEIGLRVIDASDPSNPIEAGYYETGGTAWGVSGSGSLAYVATQAYGIPVIRNDIEGGWPSNPGPGITLKIEEETPLIASACLSGEATKSFTSGKTQVQISSPIALNNGFVVFASSDILDAFNSGILDIDRIEFLDSSGGVVGHIGLQYKYCNYDNHHSLDAFVFLHSDLDPMTEDHPFWENRGNGWEYYAENEFPMSMLVPPGGSTSNVQGSSDQPVLFVHGINDYFTGPWPDCGLPGVCTSPLWGEIPESIDQGTYDSWRFYYPHDQWIPDSSVLLGRAIEDLLTGSLASVPAYDAETRMDIVAHSMGGLVARSLLQGQDYQDNVQKLLMVGTPNHGAHASYRAVKGDITGNFLDFIHFADIDAPAHEAMTPASDFLFELHAEPPAPLGSGPGQENRDYLVLAGIKEYTCLNWHEKHSEIDRQDDGFVAASSASLLSHGIPIALVDSHHRNIKLDEKLPATIETFLGGYDPYNVQWDDDWVRCFLTSSNLSPCENEGIELGKGILELNIEYSDEDVDRYKIESSDDGVMKLKENGGRSIGSGNYFLEREADGGPGFFSRSQPWTPLKDIGVEMDQGVYEVKIIREEYSWTLLGTVEITVATSTSNVLFSPLRTSIQALGFNSVNRFAMIASNGVVLSTLGKSTSSYEFVVDQEMSTVLFNLSSEEAGDFSNHGMFLVEPGGRVIDPAEAASDPLIDFSVHPTLGPAQYLINDPAPGTWTIQHEANLPGPALVVYSDGSFSTRVTFPGSGFVAGDTLVCSVVATGGESCVGLDLQTEVLYRASDSETSISLGPLALTDLGGGEYEGLIFPDAAGEYQVALNCECTPGSGPVLIRESFSNVWVDRHPDDVSAAPRETDESVIPGNLPLRLIGISPNPFNPSVRIAFEIRNSGKVSVGVYSLDGRKVATLVDQVMGKGNHQAVWRGRNEDGGKVASGVYFIRLTAQDFSLTRKVVLLK